VKINYSFGGVQMKRVVLVLSVLLLAGTVFAQEDEEEQTLLNEARTIISEVDQILTSDGPIPRNRIEVAIRSINSFERRFELWLAVNGITSVGDRRGYALKRLRYQFVMRDKPALERLLSPID